MEISNSKQPYLFRYRPDSDFTLDEIEKSYIYFPSNNQLNDPFDATHSMLRLTQDENEFIKLYNNMISTAPNDAVKKYIVQLYEGKPNDLKKFVEGIMEKFISSHGIACFTVSPVHIPLWASYANNHKGVCIQYNTDLDKDIFFGARRMDYVESFEKVDYSPITNSKASTEIFYKKLKLWREEYEIRVVKEKSGVYKLNRDAIRSIAFGLRATEEFKDKVLNIVYKNKSETVVYKTEIMNDSFGLSFIPYEM